MFKIYKDKQLSKNTYFKLEENCGEIRLLLVDDEGQLISQGYILTINSKGINLHTSVTDNAGFKLDQNGQIKLV